MNRRPKKNNPKKSKGKREQTDASLGAERAGTDGTIDRAAARERRLIDDLIERDRFLADERLMKFRERADRVVALERNFGSPADADEAHERIVTDERKQAERDTTDALLERERGRVDERTEKSRSQQDVDRAAHTAQRRVTDKNLNAERSDADASIAALDRSESKLADLQSEHVRQDEFFAMVAHDLRSPLTVIMANAGILAEDTRDAAMREAAEDISSAAARMGRLLTDLLEVARIEAGTFSVEKARHDAGVLLAEVLRVYGPLFANREITFKVDLPATPVVASFDHDRVIQLLSNLLENAMKFTPPYGCVNLKIVQSDADIEFVLDDTGPGISPDDKPHIFERFWQPDRDARRGLGLGLYICKNIAKAHGGSISVQSEPGRGATFRTSLPVN